jgi:mono/diheme cytochrome c family protein
MRLAGLIAAAAVMAGAPAAWADGAEKFQTYCAKCHGSEGMADTKIAAAMKVPALAGRDLDEDTVIHVIRNNVKHKSLSTKIDDDLLEEIAEYVEKLSKSED